MPNFLRSKRRDQKCEEHVRVIVDHSDSKKDRYLPVTEARRLYDRGELGWDETNRMYCELSKTRSHV